MWRDIAITNKKNLADALHKLEQRLAHIRENLDSKQLADEFERAHELRKSSSHRNMQARRAKQEMSSSVSPRLLADFVLISLRRATISA